MESRRIRPPAHQREQEWTKLLFIRNVSGRMIISFYKRYYCMCGLQTHLAPRLYLFLTRSWALAVGGGGRKKRRRGNLVWVVEEERGERKRERGQPLPPVWDWSVFRSWGHQLLTPPHPLNIPPSFSSPTLFLPLLLTVCYSVPCVHLLFVLCVFALNHFCHCLFRWATVVWPSSS